MSIFRTKGFDSVISKGTVVTGDIKIPPGSTFLIEGLVKSDSVTSQADVAENTKTTLFVSGNLEPNGQSSKICVTNVTITGCMVCDEIRVEGTLAIKAGAKLTANKILYRNMVSEDGAILQGNLLHLDYVSEGEIV